MNTSTKLSASRKGFTLILIVILIAFLVGGAYYVVRTEGKFCGGFAGNLPQNQCPLGFSCVLDGNYPDAGGKCTNFIKSLLPF